MSTPTVCMGLSMLALITEPKFFKINFIASQPTVIYLKMGKTTWVKNSNKLTISKYLKIKQDLHFIFAL